MWRNKRSPHGRVYGVQRIWLCMCPDCGAEIGRAMNGGDIETDQDLRNAIRQHDQEHAHDDALAAGQPVT